MASHPEFSVTARALACKGLRLRAEIGLLLIASSLCCFTASCGRAKKPVAPIDTIPPSQVRDLTATPLTHRSIKLRWTAPGDDGVEGRAKRYDIRYSTEPFPAGDHFPPLDTVASPPAPGLAEQPDSVIVAGLRPATRYYFAMRVADEKGNLSVRSNVATNLTLASPDTIPPATTTDLHVVVATNTSVTLGWTAPGDDGEVGTATSYDLRYSASPIDGANWTTASAVRDVPPPGAPGASQSCQVSGLSPDHAYYFALRTSDESGNVSELSPSFQATTTRPRVWLIRADGTGDEPTIQAGINRAWWGDTVLVEPGRYFEHVELKGRDLVLKGNGKPEDCILDGSGQTGSVIYLHNHETRSTTIEGFTITNGSGTDPNGGSERSGGGILCTNASPVIRGNIIAGNRLPSAYSVGGGLAIGNAIEAGDLPAPLIEGNSFNNNSAGHNGGALALDDCNAEVVGNRFEGNQAAFDGGAIALYMLNGFAVIEHNVFLNNSAGDHGGAVEATSSSAHPSARISIAWNILSRNSAHGLDSPDRDTGTGGGLSLRNIGGVIENNSFLFNQGTGRTDCTGGGLLLSGLAEPVRVQRNLIVGSSGCGIACYGNTSVEVVDNLLWNNVSSDFGYRAGPCPGDYAQQNLLVDPQFCGLSDTTYTLANNSPALLGSGQVIGAINRVGCAGK